MILFTDDECPSYAKFSETFKMKKLRDQFIKHRYNSTHHGNRMAQRINSHDANTAGQQLVMSKDLRAPSRQKSEHKYKKVRSIQINTHLGKQRMCTHIRQLVSTSSIRSNKESKRYLNAFSKSRNNERAPT